VQHEATLGVIDQTELVARLGDLHDVHKSGREVRIRADFSVDFDELFHADKLGLLAGQGVLEAVSEDEDERKGLTELVRALGRSGSPDTVHLGEQPVPRGIEAL